MSMKNTAIVIVMVALLSASVSMALVIDLDSLRTDDRQAASFDYDKFTSMVSSKGFDVGFEDMRDYKDAAEDDLKHLESELRSGKVIVVYGNLATVGLEGIPLSESSDRDYSAYYYDEATDATYSFLIGNEGSDQDSSVGWWIETIQTDYGDEAVPNYTRSFSQSVDEGEFNVNILYYYTGVNNYGYKYYVVGYVLQSHSLDTSWKTADFWVESQVDQTNSSMNLLDTSPDNTYVMQSVTIGEDFGSGNPQGNIAWTYTTPVVLIQNQSFGDHYSIGYDVDESQAQLYERVRPGCFVEVGPNTYFVMKEMLKVQFEGPNPNHLWPWDPETIQKSIVIQTSNCYL